MQKVLLVDPRDRVIGAAEKIDAHTRGLRHRAFSVFIQNRRGEVLLQRRAASKYHSGGLWANSCCGHPASEGEETSVAARRRLGEELGLSCDLVWLFRTSYRTRVGPTMVENEVVHIYRGLSDRDPVPAPEEVEDWAWVPVEDLASMVRREPWKYAGWLKHYVTNCSAGLRKLHPGSAQR